MATKLSSLAKPAPRSLRDTWELEARRRLIAGRHALGISQLELAMRLPASRSAVEDWERGAARIPAWVLVAVETMVAQRGVGAGDGGERPAQVRRAA